jgi:hypothetical protein
MTVKKSTNTQDIIKRAQIWANYAVKTGQLTSAKARGFVSKVASNPERFRWEVDRLTKIMTQAEEARKVAEDAIARANEI